MGERKPPQQFRATKTAKGMLIQSSRGGDVWHGAIDGMDAAGVQKQFARLKARGCIIVDTKDYQHDA